MNKIAGAVLGICVLVVLSGFLVRGNFSEDNGVRQVKRISSAPLQKEEASNRHLVDSAVSILKSGYIVLRTGYGADSYLLTQLNTKDKTYSHCGIVMVEHGYPFVYHSIGGEDNPDERLRRDSADFFFSPAHNSGIAVVRFDYDDKRVSDLRAVVTQYYKERPRFDMKFDLKTDDKLYCSEFVCKAVNKVMNEHYIKTTTVFGKTFVGIDDLFINAHAGIIWKTKFR